MGFGRSKSSKDILTRTKVEAGGSRAAATSKMERVVIMVIGFQPLNIIKRSILDVAAALDSPLLKYHLQKKRKAVADHANVQGAKYSNM